MKYTLIPALLALVACADETSSGYSTPGAEYHLREINGTEFVATATITFPEKGQISGQAPCNSWSADQPAPYPWFTPGPIAATEIACNNLDQEIRFFETLSTMNLIEFSGPILLLSGDSGEKMLFEAR